ncbi:class I SAM-dependent methyltransferase [bacterium]|nr:class I SAM-dependent methyltransferase [bacterium]
MDDPIRYWNEQAGPIWVAQQEQLDLLMDPLGLKLMEWADLAQGERVLDVGCGCGSTSIQLADRVGLSGSVTGVDVSAPMLDRARQRSSRPHWLEADAGSHPFPARFDLIYSRFGVMFFADPASAFAHLRSLLNPGGRLAFICWRPLALNPLFHLGLEAARSLVALPEPSSTELPGPFSLSPAGKVEALLSQAGFQQVEVTAWDSWLGKSDLQTLSRFLLQVGPVAAVVRESQPPVVEQIHQRLGKLLEAYAGEGGSVCLPAATWLVKARVEPGQLS